MRRLIAWLTRWPYRWFRPRAIVRFRTTRPMFHRFRPMCEPLEDRLAPGDLWNCFGAPMVAENLDLIGYRDCPLPADQPVMTSWLGSPAASPATPSEQSEPTSDKTSASEQEKPATITEKPEEESEFAKGLPLDLEFVSLPDIIPDSTDAAGIFETLPMPRAVSPSIGEDTTPSDSFGDSIESGTSPVSLDPIPDQTNVEGDTVSLDVSGSGGPAGRIFSSSALPPGLSISEDGMITGQINWGAMQSWGASQSVQITAYDPATETYESQSFLWTLNDPTTIGSPGDQTTAVGSSVSFQVPTNNPANYPLNYSVDALPNAVTLDSTNGLVSGTPTQTFAGATTVTVTTPNTTLQTSFNWTVHAAAALDDLPTRDSAVGEIISWQVPFTNPGGQEVTFSATGLPSGLTISETSGEIAGVVLQVQNANVQITLNRPNGSDSKTFSWNFAAASLALEVPLYTDTYNDEQLVFARNNFNGFQLDSPNGDDVTLDVQLSVANGTLSLATTNGLTFASGSGTNDLSMAFSGTAEAINTALDGLVYTPTQNYVGDDTLAISVSDPSGNQIGVSAAVELIVRSPIPAITETIPGGAPISGLIFSSSPTPMISGTAKPGSKVTLYQDGVEIGWQIADAGGYWNFNYEEHGGGELLADGEYEFTAEAEIDAITFTSAPVTITIDTTPPEVVLTSPSTTTSVTPTVHVTADDLNGAPDDTLVTVDLMDEDGYFQTFATGAIINGEVEIELPQLAAGVYYFQARTTDVAGNVGTSNIVSMLVWPNGSPTLGPTLEVPAAQETESGVALEISDPILIGETDPREKELKVTLSVEHGTLTLAIIDNLFFDNGSGEDDVSMTFTGSAADINAALDGLTYTSTAEFVGDDTLSITVEDSASNNTAQVEISVLAAAIIGPSVEVPTAQWTDENTDLIFSDSGDNLIYVADSGPANTILTVDLSASDGTLTLATLTGLTFSAGDGDDDELMTFSGTAADINAALDGLTYSPDTDFDGDDALTITVNDPDTLLAGQGAAVAVIDIVVFAAPVPSVGPSVDVWLEQWTEMNTALEFSFDAYNPLIVGDSGPSNTVLTVSLSVGNGAISLAATAGLTFSAGDGIDDDEMTFSGVAADINAALDGLVYTPETDFLGHDTLAVTVDDPDTLANQTGAAVANVDIAVAYPLPQLTVPTGGAAVTAGMSTTLAITAESESGIASVEWWISFNGEDYELIPGLTELSQEYTFPNYGFYDVYARVTDNDGYTSDLDFRVDVNEAIPEDLDDLVTATGYGFEGNVVTFNVKGVYVDESDTTSLYADWYGDGNFEEVSPDQWTVEADGSVSFDHLYDNNGGPGVSTLMPVIRLENEGGGHSDYEVQIEIANVAPEGTLGAFGELGSEAIFSTAEDNGQEIWRLGMSLPLEFRDVVDPSLYDLDHLKYHWILTDEFDGSTKTYVTDQAYLPLPKVVGGKLYTVSAWITDPDGAWTEPQNIRVVVGSQQPNPGPWNSDSNWDETWHADGLEDLIYGTLKVAEEPLPEKYNRFTGEDEIHKDPWSTVNLLLKLDSGSENLVAGGMQAEYVFIVEVYDVEQSSIGNGKHDLLSRTVYTNGSGALNLGSFPADREINVAARSRLLSGGETAKVSPIYKFTAVTPKTPTTAQTIRQLVDETLGPLADWIGNQVQWVIDTIKSVGEKIADGINALKNLAPLFADKAEMLVKSILNAPRRFLSTLEGGLSEAVTKFINQLPTALKNGFFTWMMGTTPITGSFNFDNADDLSAFLLQYAGLTWDNVTQIVLEQLGEGNLAAVSAVADWFAGANTSDPKSLVPFLRKVMGPQWSTLQTQLLQTAKAKITSMATTAIPQLLAKFAPGAGIIKSIYEGATWVLNNTQQLANVITQFLNSANLLAGYQKSAFGNALYGALTNPATVSTILSFAASQLGLGALPEKIREAIQFVPAKVTDFLRKAVAPIAKNLKGGLKGDMFDGLLATKKEFEYQGQDVRGVGGQG